MRVGLIVTNISHPPARVVAEGGMAVVGPAANHLLQGLGALVTKPTVGVIPKGYKDGGYLESKKIPKDPWGNDYVYEVADDGQGFLLYSHGPGGESGTSSQFADCYNTTWGQFIDRTKPIPGNHEYMTSGASAYYQYFNTVPYYAYDLGAWRIYALNSEIDVSETSEQVQWLQADLAANPRQCVLAYWHKPRWSSGTHHGSNAEYQTLWQVLYQAGAELVLNGHEHNYERFTPMNADGQPDPQGLREFVAGTGGRDHYGFGNLLPTGAGQARELPTAALTYVVRMRW